MACLALEVLRMTLSVDESSQILIFYAYVTSFCRSKSHIIIIEAQSGSSFKWDVAVSES